MTRLLTPKTERVKKWELPLLHQVAVWAQVALMAWMLSWGNPQLEYVAVGTAQIDCAIAQPKGIAAGEPSGCERITPSKLQSITRDGVGRIATSTQSLNGTSELSESLLWRKDGTQTGDVITRNGSVSPTENRAYGYDSRGHLIGENFSPSSGLNGSATYAFDGGAPGGLGLRTGVTLGTGLSGVNTTTYGTFARMTNEALSGSLTNALGTPITQSYDAAGNTTNRTSGSTIDSLTWDAMGQLVGVNRSGGGSFSWSAVYDGLGRRLQITQGSLVIQSSYDPDIEFLDLGVTVKSGATSTRYWKIQGPDLNGIYGGLQGTGGLEAIYNQSAGTTKTILSDTYGHVEGALTGSTFVWNNHLFDGYGTLPSSSASVPLTSSNDLASVLGWRGKSIDPTGYYYLGARYYVPDSGEFLSPDPLGHAASWDLYSYCNGDPINNFDADGRFGKGALTGESYNAASSVGAIFGGSTQITQSTQMASSLIQSYQGNLQMFDGNQYDAINATVNPAYTAIAKYNEAVDGLGYSYNNLGSSLSTADRVFSGVQSAVGAVSTVGVGFGGAGLATASGLTAPAENFAANSYLNSVDSANGASLYNSFVPGTARLNIGFGGQNAFRAADSIGGAASGRFASLEMPSSPAQAIQQNALAPQFGNNASQLFQVTTRSGFNVQGTAASQGVGFEGGATQIFQSRPPSAIGPWKSVTPIPYISQ